MRTVDWTIIAVMVAAVLAIIVDKTEPGPERQLQLAAHACWDSNLRAVYVRVDGEYIIRCEP